MTCMQRIVFFLFRDEYYICSYVITFNEIKLECIVIQYEATIELENHYVTGLIMITCGDESIFLPDMSRDNSGNGFFFLKADGLSCGTSMCSVLRGVSAKCLPVTRRACALPRLLICVVRR